MNWRRLCRSEGLLNTPQMMPLFSWRTYRKRASDSSSSSVDRMPKTGCDAGPYATGGVPPPLKRRMSAEFRSGTAQAVTKPQDVGGQHGPL